MLRLDAELNKDIISELKKPLGKLYPDFEDAIEAKIVAAKNDYAAKTDLSAVNADLSVSWEWPFLGSSYEGGTGHANQTDEKDTFLGDRAAGTLDNAGNISIDLTVTVTQID